MAKNYAKILGMMTIVLSVLPLNCAFPAGNEETSVILYDFKLPEYDRESGELDYIIYGKKAETIDVMINLEELKVEWYGKDRTRIKAVITTPEGVYDKSTKIIRGEKEVHFRSPSMDVDGIGFDADQKNQTIHVRSSVKVKLKENLQTEKERKETGRIETSGVSEEVRKSN